MRNVIQLCLATNNFLLMRKRHHAFLILLLAIALAWKMAESFASRRYSLKNKLGDRMIKQLLNSVMAKYRDLSVSRRSIIICLSLRLVPGGVGHGPGDQFCPITSLQMADWFFHLCAGSVFDFLRFSPFIKWFTIIFFGKVWVDRCSKPQFL